MYVLFKVINYFYLDIDHNNKDLFPIVSTVFGMAKTTITRIQSDFFKTEENNEQLEKKCNTLKSHDKISLVQDNIPPADDNISLAHENIAADTAKTINHQFRNQRNEEEEKNR